MSNAAKSLDSLTMRVACIVKANGIHPATDKSDVTAQIEVSASLPFIAIEDDVIDRTSYFTYNQTADTKEDIVLTISDPDYFLEMGLERFIYMGMVRAPQTENAVRFYYDRKYQDIITMPDIDFFKSDVLPGVYPLSGYCVGKLSTTGEVMSLDETVAVNENTHRNIPVPFDEEQLLNNGTGLSLDSCFITGTNKSLWYKSLEIAKTLNDGTQLNTTQVEVINIVTLGAPAELFGDANVRVPHHVLYQYSPLKHMIKPQGCTAMKTKIRVAIRL